MEVKKLVAYFSATGKTKGVSLKLGQMMKADTYEIKPKKKYTEADLNWTNKKSRSSIEMGDPKSRVELSDKSANISNYDTIYLGFPIWWGSLLISLIFFTNVFYDGKYSRYKKVYFQISKMI